MAIDVDPNEVAISEKISLALIEAVANDQLQAGARVVVVYSGFEAEELDSLSVIRLGEHLEQLTARDLRALETSVPFETLKAVVDAAIEIGREGREGKPVGTLIVVGDARNVMLRTRQLGFDPFKGYKRKERNVRDFRVREAIKEIAQLDGAFVVARDGTVEAACRLIDAPMSGLTLPKGLGSRHWAAAGDHRGHQVRRRRREPVEWHRPAVPERRHHPAHRPHATRPGHEMARRRDRALAGMITPFDRHNRQMTSPTSLLVQPLYRIVYGPPLQGRSTAQAGLPDGKAAAQQGLVLVADGVGGFDMCGTALRYVLAAEKLPYAVEVFPWGHGFLRWFADLSVTANRDEKARVMAESVRRYKAEHPADPVFLVAKSGGSGVVVKALEQLLEQQVDRAVLLAPALSPGYDLSCALRAVRCDLVVFWSPLDVMMLGIGTTVFSGPSIG